jgi:hypothetical protein
VTTPFMTEVEAVLAGRQPPPFTLPASRPQGVAHGTDAQVAARVLAEQLVSEANAVLRAGGATIDLDDEPGPDGLAFTLRHRDRQARVETRFDDGATIATVDGRAVEVGNASNMAALLLALVADDT